MLITSLEAKVLEFLDIDFQRLYCQASLKVALMYFENGEKRAALKILEDLMNQHMIEIRLRDFFSNIGQKHRLGIRQTKCYKLFIITLVFIVVIHLDMEELRDTQDINNLIHYLAKISLRPDDTFMSFCIDNLIILSEIQKLHDNIENEMVALILQPFARQYCELKVLAEELQEIEKARIAARIRPKSIGEFLNDKNKYLYPVKVLPEEEQLASSSLLEVLSSTSNHLRQSTLKPSSHCNDKTNSTAFNALKEVDDSASNASDNRKCHSQNLQNTNISTTSDHVIETEPKSKKSSHRRSNHYLKLHPEKLQTKDLTVKKYFEGFVVLKKRHKHSKSSMASKDSTDVHAAIEQQPSSKLNCAGVRDIDSYFMHLIEPPNHLMQESHQDRYRAV